MSHDIFNKTFVRRDIKNLYLLKISFVLFVRRK